MIYREINKYIIHKIAKSSSLLNNKYLKTIVTEILRGRDIDSDIYDYYVKDPHYSEYINFLYSKNNGYYNSLQSKWSAILKNEIGPICVAKKWGGGGSQGGHFSHWFSFYKPYKNVDTSNDDSSDDSNDDYDNLKIYITFNKGDMDTSESSFKHEPNFSEFFDNLRKIGDLVKHLDEADTKGPVSFKTLTLVSDNLVHKDNIVIHYRNKQDKPLIEEAISKTHFNSRDRSEIGRTTHGVDKEGTSDSKLVAEKAAEKILKPKTLESFKKYFSQPEDSPDYQKGLEILKKILDEEMFNSSHRNV